MKRLLKLVVPKSRQAAVRRLYSRAVNAGLARRCPVCRSHLRRFAPHGVPVEEEAVCPVCRSKAPHRLARLFFERNLQLFRPGGLMVHVAPEPELGRLLAAWSAKRGMKYRCGAINGSGDQYLDILRLPFADGQVDLLYCCHVLNMLQDDRGAMREVCRVLRTGGTAVLQVPAFYRGQETLEPHSLEERLRVLQDAAMFRCYTPDDFVRRVQHAGFDVEVFSAASFPAAVIRRYSLKHEVLHVCRKAV